MIAGTAKSYNLPPDYILYDMSYVNVTLYGAVLPSYDSKKEDKDKEKTTINADDPKNKRRLEQLVSTFK